MRRHANAAAGVGAEPERRTAGGDDRGFSAAAAARGAGEVVRVIGASIDQIIGLDRSGQFRHVGLAEDDAARGAKPRNRGRIGFGNEIRAALGATGADDAIRLQRILDGNGHAMQRTSDLAARQRRIGFVRLFPR
jgi:hypothetical protein